jgi:fumarate reductase subunit D
MKHLLLRLEPLIWLLFGQGILIGTILLTGWLLVVGVAAPLGWVPEGALAFERAQRLAGNPIGRLLLLALIALPLWKGAHHLRSLSIDFGGVSRDPAVAGLLYGLALLGSGLGILAVIRL